MLPPLCGTCGMCWQLNLKPVTPVLCKLNISLPVHDKNILTLVITRGRAVRQQTAAPMTRAS